MASITKEEVLNIANLARLSLNENEVEYYSEKLSLVLNYIEQLNEVQTKATDLKSSTISFRSNAPKYEEGEIPWREDKVQSSLPKEAVLKNAPETDGKHLMVPKVVDKSEG